MPELQDPYRRDQLLAALETLDREIAEGFDAVAGDDFFRRPGDGVWSPAENLVHLVKSVKAVAAAMGYPKLMLGLLFGRSKSPSRRFGEIRDLYLAELDRGARAGGRFLPELPPPEGPEAAAAARARALRGWRSAGQALRQALAGWSEEALDRYRLPHPLLGKLTVREMLLFTLYHNRHHLLSVRKRLA